jgi:Xaa-Pro aminopeptidase
LTKSKIKKIKFDPYEFSLAIYQQISKKTNTKLVCKPHMFKLQRAIKQPCEIDKLKKAITITRQRFEKIKKLTHIAGITEYEFNYRTKEILTNKGERQLSFAPITAFDKNSAKPHATPTKEKLNKNSLVLVDGGVKYEYYCSDRTETFINHKIPLQTQIYSIVQKAQHIAIQKAVCGMKASKLDTIAREVIDKAGYGKYFSHSLGHGVGLDIHEYPIISQKSSDILEDGAVFTIEPGIYLPDYFGVRIEDCVVMKDGKAEVL